MLGTRAPHPVQQVLGTRAPHPVHKLLSTRAPHPVHKLLSTRAPHPVHKLLGTRALLTDGNVWSPGGGDVFGGEWAAHRRKRGVDRWQINASIAFNPQLAPSGSNPTPSTHLFNSRIHDFTPLAFPRYIPPLTGLRRSSLVPPDGLVGSATGAVRREHAGDGGKVSRRATVRQVSEHYREDLGWVVSLYCDGISLYCDGISLYYQCSSYATHFRVLQPIESLPKRFVASGLVIGSQGLQGPGGPIRMAGCLVEGHRRSKHLTLSRAIHH
eukprot:1195461-Prorocentrum_minimum.AAC.1